MNAIPYEPAILAGCHGICCVEQSGVKAHSFELLADFDNKKAAGCAAGGFLSGSSASSAADPN
jgi:hypothetical protein